MESFVARQNRIGRTFVSADAPLATVREFAAEPHTVLKTSGDKIRWTASRDPCKRDAKTGARAVW